MTDQGSEWEDLAGWWVDEVAADEIFATDVLPLLDQLVGNDAGGTWLDVGCGEGRAMRGLDIPVMGCDIAFDLLKAATPHGPVARTRLPELGWVSEGAFAGAYLVLTLEHIADVEALFSELRRVVRTGGHLVVVANHPSFTAEHSGPIVDLDDGEVLWRWGTYFDQSPVATSIDGRRQVTFHHRSLGALLTTAASAGWSLLECEERPLSEAAVAAFPGYAGQESIPRLLGLRWRIA